MSRDCYIFTGGQVFAESLAELNICIGDDAFVIAADSGYASARRLGVRCDVLLGDLDSLDTSHFTKDELDRLEKIIVSPIKDDTDTQLAVDTAISRGAECIYIIGGLGGRLDHTLSSVFLLEYIADKGVGCIMTDGKNRVRIMCARTSAEKLRIERVYKYLSLVSLTDECRGVSASGVYYPLEGATVTRSYSYAVSNEMTSDFAEISLDTGVMLVIESRD